MSHEVICIIGALSCMALFSIISADIFQKLKEIEDLEQFLRSRES